jgi:hypothetical protein
MSFWQEYGGKVGRARVALRTITVRTRKPPAGILKLARSESIDPAQQIKGPAFPRLRDNVRGEFDARWRVGVLIGCEIGRTINPIFSHLSALCAASIAVGKKIWGQTSPATRAPWPSHARRFQQTLRAQRKPFHEWESGTRLVVFHLPQKRLESFLIESLRLAALVLPSLDG